VFSARRRITWGRQPHAGGCRLPGMKSRMPALASRASSMGANPCGQTTSMRASTPCRGACSLGVLVGARAGVCVATGSGRVVPSDQIPAVAVAM